MSLMGGALPGGLPDESVPGLDLWQVKIDPQALAGYPTAGAGGLLMGKATGYQITGYDGLGLPAQRNVDVALPDDHGVRALGDFHTGRTITLGIAINHSLTCQQGAAGAAQAASDAFDDLRTLAGWWQARGTDVVMELRWTNGQTYLVTGRPRNLAEDTSKLYRGIITVALSFLATDPRYYDVAMSTAVASLQSTTSALVAPGRLKVTGPETTSAVDAIYADLGTYDSWLGQTTFPGPATITPTPSKAAALAAADTIDTDLDTMDAYTTTVNNSQDAIDAVTALEADLDIIDEFLLEDPVPGEFVVSPTPDAGDSSAAADWITLDLNTIDDYLTAPVEPPPVVTPPPGGLCLTGGVSATTQVLCVPTIGGLLCAPVVVNGNGTAFNKGNTATLPRISIFGDYTNPQLINVTTGRTIKFVGTFSGQVLTVDMSTREISLDGTVRFDLLGSQADFWDLIPGANEIHLRQTATTQAQARIDWRHAWL